MEIGKITFIWILRKHSPLESRKFHCTRVCEVRTYVAVFFYEVLRIASGFLTLLTGEKVGRVGAIPSQSCFQVLDYELL